MKNKLLLDDTVSSMDFVKFILNNGHIDKPSVDEVGLTYTDLPILITKSVLFPFTYLSTTINYPKGMVIMRGLCDNPKPFGVITKNTDGHLCKYGTVADLVKVLKIGQDSIQILLRGVKKFEIVHVNTDETAGTVRTIQDDKVDIESSKYQIVSQLVNEATNKLIELNPNIPNEIKVLLTSNYDFNILTYLLSSGLDIPLSVQQKLLTMNDCIKRGYALLKYLSKEVKMAEMRKKIQEKIQSNISQSQKEYYIKHQIEALHEELGDNDFSDIDEIRSRGEKKVWPKHAQDAFLKDLAKAERLTSNNADYAILLNHAELIVDLPWDSASTTNKSIDIEYATKVLNKEHFGMENVKDRILEYLSVLKMNPKYCGQILCLYGAPGVGKTSLCTSIAKALNRKYVKVSLGGIQDEAEIRGHRKTYVGAMPGKIIKGIQTAKASNPVFVLDELDKLCNNVHGNPSAALLEVLDPEQNFAFMDHFLDVPYDLSNVLFIGTINRLDTVAPELLDRLEIVNVSGYAIEEKIHIAKDYIIPKQRKESGLKKSQIQFTDDAITKIIDYYTRESGVRELKRQVNSIFRKVTRKVVENKKYNKNIDSHEVVNLLGVEKYERDLAQHISIPGVAIGMAWTAVGGDILFIESTLVPGTGKLVLSGQLGDVMKESAMITYTYLKAHYSDLNINNKVFDVYDVHMHFPDGATPKDGPSAGITMYTALASLFSQRKVKDNLAMTGEMTLRGNILPVGGIKEKVLAAKRSNIKDIVMCEENRKNVMEIKQDYLAGITFHYLKKASEVIPIALCDTIDPNAIDFNKRIEEAQQHRNK